MAATGAFEVILTAIAGWIGLAFGSLWVLLSVTATVPWTGRHSVVRGYYDTISLAGSELGPQLLLIGLVVGAVLWWAGAANSWVGMTGLLLTGASLLLLMVPINRGWNSRPAFEAALREALGPDYRQRILPERAVLLRDEVTWRDWIRPTHFDLTGIETLPDITYGPHGERNLLDLLRPAAPLPPGSRGRPVLIQMHGGGYMAGGKNMAGLPLVHHLVRRGWMAVTINYRFVPTDRWPSQLIDAKRAVAWVRDHIAQYGGDPGFIAAAGGSAGGNLSSLLALTAGQARYQPGFEVSDTRIQAAVPFYAGYSTARVNSGDLLARLVYENVLPLDVRDDPQVQDDPLPMTHLTPAAAPFFILTGTHDGLALPEEARAFVQRLRAVSRAPVVYAEVHGAYHGFDDAHSMRAEHAADAVQRFLEVIYSDYLRERPAQPADATASRPATHP